MSDLPYISPYVLDNGLNAILRGSSRLSLHDHQPTDWVLADADVIGVETPLVVTGPSVALPGGRRVTVEAIPDGNILKDGHATHWALLDDTRKLVLASAPLANPLNVFGGHKFTLAAFDIILPGV